MQTLQQERAAYALEAVMDRAKVLAPAERKKFKSRASELPFMIHANGLGQAAAFYKSKRNKDGHDHLYAILNGWLTRADRPLKGHQDLLDGIVKSPIEIYMAAQVEAMMLMDWVKKFANAFLEEKESK